jgi:hypothetical protein
MMNRASDWMHEFGEYEYYALVLSDFDPFKAKQIMSECSLSDIARAMTAKTLYHKKQK